MKVKGSVSPGAAMAAGVLIYYTSTRNLMALALPVLAHELGHLLVLRMFGCQIRELSLELGGLCIRYSGTPGSKAAAASAFAGPLAGLLYALAAAHCGSFGALSAGFSLILSAYNLIPALPLDGGRIAEALLPPRASMLIGLISSIATAVLGLWLLVAGMGGALAAAGAYLLLWQLFSQSKSSAMLPD